VKKTCIVFSFFSKATNSSTSLRKMICIFKSCSLYFSLFFFDKEVESRVQKALGDNAEYLNSRLLASGQGHSNFSHERTLGSRALMRVRHASESTRTRYRARLAPRGAYYVRLRSEKSRVRVRTDRIARCARYKRDDPVIEDIIPRKFGVLSSCFRNVGDFHSLCRAPSTCSSSDAMCISSYLYPKEIRSRG